MRVLLALFALLAVSQAFRLRVTNAVTLVNNNTVLQCSGTTLHDQIYADNTCVALPTIQGVTFGYAFGKVTPSGATYSASGYSDAACTQLVANTTATGIPFGTAITGRIPNSPTDLGSNCEVVTATAAFVAPALALLALLVAFL